MKERNPGGQTDELRKVLDEEWKCIEMVIEREAS